MRSRIGFIAFLAVVALSMGDSCRQETAQSVLNAFLTELAETTGQAIGETLVEGATP
jgi:hypothetical protein